MKESEIRKLRSFMTHAESVFSALSKYNTCDLVSILGLRAYNAWRIACYKELPQVRGCLKKKQEHESLNTKPIEDYD